MSFFAPKDQWFYILCHAHLFSPWVGTMLLNVSSVINHLKGIKCCKLHEKKKNLNLIRPVSLVIGFLSLHEEDKTWLSLK